MRETYKEEMTMKKLFATLVTLCLCFGFCSTAYALSPDDLTAGKEADVRTSEVYDLSDISIYNVLMFMAQDYA